MDTANRIEAEPSSDASPLPFIVLPLDVSDPSIEALIYSGWIKPEKAANEIAWEQWRATRKGEPPVPTHSLCVELHRRIERILPRASVVGATTPDDADVILGFAVAEPGKLHWLSTKAGFRRHGIAREMMAALNLWHKGQPLVVTSRTARWQSFAKHNGIRYTFDPFAVE